MRLPILITAITALILSSCAIGDDTPITPDDSGVDASACMSVCPHVAAMATENPDQCPALCAAHPDLTNEDQMTYIMLDAFSK